MFKLLRKTGQALLSRPASLSARSRTRAGTTPLKGRDGRLKGGE